MPVAAAACKRYDRPAASMRLEQLHAAIRRAARASTTIRVMMINTNFSHGMYVLHTDSMFTLPQEKSRTLGRQAQ